MYSVYNVQTFITARVDEEEGTIVLTLAHLDKPFVITKDDELYEHHLKNIQVSRAQIEKAYPLDMDPTNPAPKEPANPLKG